MKVVLDINRLKLTAHIFFLFILFTVPALAALSTWPDTGQTKCYDGTQEISCPAPGEPFYGQDAQFTGPTRSYTLLAGGTMVQDNVTGLIWEMKNSMDGTANFSNPHDADNTYTWCDPNTATNGGDPGTCGANNTLDFIGQLNSASFGGYTNWRIPTIKELETLVDRNRNAPPAIDPIFDPTSNSTLQLSNYWSSTNFVNSPTYAWYENFYWGGSGVELKSYGRCVRAVRDGQ